MFFAAADFSIYRQSDRRLVGHLAWRRHHYLVRFFPPQKYNAPEGIWYILGYCSVLCETCDCLPNRKRVSNPVWIGIGQWRWQDRHTHWWLIAHCQRGGRRLRSSTIWRTWSGPTDTCTEKNSKQSPTIAPWTIDWKENQHQKCLPQAWMVQAKVAANTKARYCQ